LALFAKEQMSDHSFFVLFKKATKRTIALSLFQKERQKEQSLFRSFKKSDKKSYPSFALSKRGKSKNEQKMRDFPNRLFFAQKKRAITHFHFERMPNPDSRARISNYKS